MYDNYNLHQSGEESDYNFFKAYIITCIIVLLATLYLAISYRVEET